MAGKLLAFAVGYLLGIFGTLVAITYLAVRDDALRARRGP